MNLRISIDVIVSKIKEIHGDEIELDKLTYRGMEKKCRFIDKDYGEWWTKPCKIIHRKQGHKNRGASKAKRVFLAKYGVSSPLKNKDIKEKTRQTCLKRYGVDNPCKCAAVQEKTKQTFIRKYGFSSALKCKSVREKIKLTCLKRYGVDCASKDKNIKEKSRQTCLRKYGVPYILQDPAMALKQARSANNSYILKHWFSNEEIVCQGSYERKVIEYFNKNQIDYNWQPQVFAFPNKEGRAKTYRPDCYLPDQDKWIEIKGYFWDDAEEKWNWFHKEYPNSELWNENKLKEMNIL